MGLENQKVSSRAPSAAVEGFNKLPWGQQRRLLLQVFGSALVTASISSLSGCGEQEGEEPTPIPTKSIEPTSGIDSTPVPSPTAERPLEVRAFGGIEGELLEVTFNGETQKVMKYLGADDNPFFALSTYPTKGPGNSSATKQFEEQHVFFPSSQENWAYLLLRRTPDEVLPEALPFYDMTNDRLRWIVDHQSLKEEDAFLKLNQGESLEFDEEIGLYWLIDSSGKIKESIKVFEPEPIKIELTPEQARQILEQSSFGYHRPDGTMLHELRETEKGLEIFFSIGDIEVHEAFIKDSLPARLETSGYGVLTPAVDLEKLVVYYQDKDGVTRQIMPLVDGVHNFITSRSTEANDLQTAAIDNLTRITGELSLYNSDSQYINGEIGSQGLRVLGKTTNEKLAQVFSSLFEDSRYFDNATGKLNENGRQLASEIIDIWQKNLIIFSPSSPEALKIAQATGIDLNRLGFTTDQEQKIQATLVKKNELIGTEAEEHLYYLSFISMLVSVDAAKVLLRFFRRAGPFWNVEPPPGSAEKWITSFIPKPGIAVLHPGFYESGDWPYEAQAIYSVALLIHEGANIYNSTYLASYPPMIEVLEAYLKKYPQYEVFLQYFIDFNTRYMNEHKF